MTGHCASKSHREDVRASVIISNPGPAQPPRTTIGLTWTTWRFSWTKKVSFSWPAQFSTTKTHFFPNGSSLKTPTPLRPVPAENLSVWNIKKALPSPTFPPALKKLDFLVYIGYNLNYYIPDMALHYFLNHNYTRKGLYEKRPFSICKKTTQGFGPHPDRPLKKGRCGSSVRKRPRAGETVPPDGHDEQNPFSLWKTIGTCGPPAKR